MRLMKTLLVCLMLTSMTACGMITGTECAWSKKISPSQQDTIGTKRQVKAHNLKVVKFCR